MRVVLGTDLANCSAAPSTVSEVLRIPVRGPRGHALRWDACVKFPDQTQANEDFFRRSKAEWDSLGGLPVPKGNGATPVTAAALTEGDRVLRELHCFLLDFIAYPSMHAAIAHTLWIAHTHLMDVWESTPRLAFLSPEPGSGKTRAIEITELLVPRPVAAISATPAYIFRKIADKDGLPTLLWDEIDTVFGPKAKENEEIRGVLNAGHRRGATAGRCVVRGKSIETEELPAFCAVAMAGLGGLPDTILSRSVIIRMRRRTPDEKVKPYRRRIDAPTGYALRARLEAWAATVKPTARESWPQMPPEITDRDADVWEALLAVADAAGCHWPELARVAAVTLVTDRAAATASLGVRLLTDLKTVFGRHDALSTKDILDALYLLDESPWGDLKGKPLDARRLSTLLRPYDVTSTTIRNVTGVAKGYKREDLYEPWLRYVSDFASPESLLKKVTYVTQVTNIPQKGGAPLTPDASVTSVTAGTNGTDVNSAPTEK